MYTMNNIKQTAFNKISKHGVEVTFKRFSGQETIKSSIYGESKNKKFSEGNKVKALVYFNPTYDMITEAGMDKSRTEIIVKVSKEEMFRANLLDPNGEPKIISDDIMVINGLNYKINKTTLQALYKGEFNLFAFGGIRA